jgi:hypothetical protein
MNTEPRTILEAAVTAGQPLLSADEANYRVIELTLETIRLKAKLDAGRVTLWDEGIRP